MPRIHLYHWSSPRVRKEDGVRLPLPFKTSLPLREIMLFDYWVLNVPIVICGRGLYLDLIAIKLQNCNVILGMTS